MFGYVSKYNIIFCPPTLLVKCKMKNKSIFLKDLVTEQYYALLLFVHIIPSNIILQLFYARILYNRYYYIAAIYRCSEQMTPSRYERE